MNIPDLRERFGKKLIHHGSSLELLGNMVIDCRRHRSLIP